MTEFQYPAEQGSTAEDFLGSQSPYPMYQYSVFLNGGRDEQLVVRASTFSELLEGKRNINKVLDKVNGQNGVVESNEVSECAHNETRVFKVKKICPNQGREFKSCTHCKKFLGFV